MINLRNISSLANIFFFLSVQTGFMVWFQKLALEVCESIEMKRIKTCWRRKTQPVLCNVF